MDRPQDGHFAASLLFRRLGWVFACGGVWRRSCGHGRPWLTELAGRAHRTQTRPAKRSDDAHKLGADADGERPPEIAAREASRPVDASPDASKDDRYPGHHAGNKVACNRDP